MRNSILLLIFILSLGIYANEIYLVKEPELINVEQDASIIIKELIIDEMENNNLTVITDTLESYNYSINIKILKFEDSRAKFVLKLYNNNGELEFKTEKIITDNDKLDIFIKRMVQSMLKREEFKNTKEYGNVIAEEETISDLEEPFKIKFELDIGAHLGNEELTLSGSNNDDFSYLPVYFAMGASFNKPDYFISLKTLSIFQGIGIKVGYYKLASRKINTAYYGCDFGVGIFYGVTENTGVHPYFSPLASFSLGYFIGRTNQVHLKPELRIETAYRKSGTVDQLIVGANVFLTLEF